MKGTYLSRRRKAQNLERLRCSGRSSAEALVKDEERRVERYSNEYGRDPAARYRVPT